MRWSTSWTHPTILGGTQIHPDLRLHQLRAMSRIVSHAFPVVVSCLTALSGPAYDLGWGSQVPEGGPDDTMSGHDNSATYDLGWGSATPTNPSAPAAVPVSCYLRVLYRTRV